MINDAKVEVDCDGDDCFECLEIGLPFTYPDLSGKDGRYDHRPSAVNPLIEAEGWGLDPDDNDRHLCPGCKAYKEEFP